MTPDTHTKLKEIAERVKKATSGPWKFIVKQGTAEVFGPDSAEYSLCLLNSHYGFFQDGKFIAHSREDVPFLLDLIDKQARALEIARAEIYKTAISNQKMEIYEREVPTLSHDKLVAWILRDMREAREALTAINEVLK